MADDDSKSGNGYGTVAGSLAGAAVGVALISNPAGALSLLGVGLIAAPAAAAGGFGLLAASAIVAGCLAVGALAGNFISKHLNGKDAEKDNYASTASHTPPRVRPIAVAPEVSQQQAHNWTKKVETSRVEAASTTDRGPA